MSIGVFAINLVCYLFYTHYWSAKSNFAKYLFTYFQTRKQNSLLNRCCLNVQFDTKINGTLVITKRIVVFPHMECHLMKITKFTSILILWFHVSYEKLIIFLKVKNFQNLSCPILEKINGIMIKIVFDALKIYGAPKLCTVM